jgi:rhodanese-related sulfurtransferase
MKHILCRMMAMLLLLLPVFTSIVAQARQLSPELIAQLQEAKNNIYHLSAQELLELVQHDVGAVREVSAQELQQLMHEQLDILVINVLSEKWYNDCHIAGSMNVPLDKLIERAQELDKKSKIVVYCALNECDASKKAAILLLCMGFEDVSEYPGGIKEWYQAGYATEGACLSGYLHDAVAHRGEMQDICPSEDNFCALLRRSCCESKMFFQKDDA